MADLFTVRNAVQYWEDGDGYQENWATDQAEVTRRLRCEWAKRFSFVDALVGYTEFTANGDLWTRYPPEPAPDVKAPAPTFAGGKFYAVSMRLARKLGFQSQDNLGRVAFRQRLATGEVLIAGAGDGYAEYDVTYRRLLFEPLADDKVTTELERYVVRRPKFAIENLTLPSQSFKWSTAGDTGTPAGAAVPAGIASQAVAGDVTKPFPTMALTYEWLQVPKPPSLAINNHQGKVNSATFDASYGNFAAQTLLFHSIDTTPRVYPNGGLYWDINFQFLFRPGGWNKIFKGGSGYGDFYRVVNKEAGKPALYDTVDFAELFKASNY